MCSKRSAHASTSAASRCAGHRCVRVRLPFRPALPPGDAPRWRRRGAKSRCARCSTSSGRFRTPPSPRAQLVGVGRAAHRARSSPRRSPSAVLIARSSCIPTTASTRSAPPAQRTPGSSGEGVVAERDISPADFGLPAHPLQAVDRRRRGRETPATILAILDGAEGPEDRLRPDERRRGPLRRRDGGDFGDGVALAREAIGSGRAREVLDHYVALTQEVAGG